MLNINGELCLCQVNLIQKTKKKWCFLVVACVCLRPLVPVTSKENKGRFFFSALSQMGNSFFCHEPVVRHRP